MGALDDLIARDEENQRKGSGRMSELDQLMANDSVRNLPSQDPELPAEAPSFVGYDPTTAPPKEEDPYAGLREFAQQLTNGPAQQMHLPERPANPGEILLGGGLKAAQGAGRVARAGLGIANTAVDAGTSAVLGAAEGFDKSADRSLAGRAQSALEEGETQGMIGGAVSGGLKTLGGAGSTISDMADWLARKADNVKAGATSRIRQDLIEKFGIEDGPDMLGQLVRRYSPSSLLSPKTSAGHLGAIEKQYADEGLNHASMVRQAGEEGADAAVPRAYAGAQDEMLNTAAALDDEALAAGKAAEVQMLEQILNRTAAKPVPQSLEGLISRKAQFGDEAFRPVTNATDEDAKSQAAKHAWRAMRGAQDQAVSAATPDTAGRLQDSDKVFSELSSLRESLSPRAAADDSVGNVGSAAVSAGAASLVDPSMGILSTLASGTNNAIRQATGGVAHDVFSNVMRPTSAATGFIGDAAQTAARPASMAADEAQDAFQSLSSKPEKPGAQVAVGHKRVSEALRSDPSKLGPFAKMLEGTPPEELPARIRNLADREPMFARILRELEDESNTQSRPQSGITFSMEGE